jgi:hypothetical protein
LNKIMAEDNKKKTWLKNLGWGAIGLFQYLGC